MSEENEDDGLTFYKNVEKFNDPDVKSKMRNISKILGNLIKQKELELYSEGYGLVKGQHVAKHVRTSSTGKKFVSGSGGSGSPETVLAEKKTVAGVGAGGGTSSPLIGGKSEEIVGYLGGKGGSASDPTNVSITGGDNPIPESSVFNPATLALLVSNISNADTAKLQKMATELFKMPPSRDRGFVAELLLKEVLVRGIVGQSIQEKQKSDIEKKSMESKNAGINEHRPGSSNK